MLLKEKRYSTIKVIQGKVHEYPGMNLDYSLKVQVNTTMLDFIKEIMDCFEKSEPKSSGTKSSTAPLNLFVVDEERDNTMKEKSETFHKLVSKMLFATKRAILDTGISISYLNNILREPD